MFLRRLASSWGSPRGLFWPIQRCPRQDRPRSKLGPTHPCMYPQVEPLLNFEKRLQDCRHTGQLGPVERGSALTTDFLSLLHSHVNPFQRRLKGLPASLNV